MALGEERLNDNVQVNFNHSKEISYWSKKYNISPEMFRKAFEESGYSISKTLQLCNEGLNKLS